MPELPDIVAYIDALEGRLIGQPIGEIRLKTPFLLRTVDPPLDELVGKTVRTVRRFGKRIVIGLDDDLFIVLHLMIAGRLHWKPRGAKAGGRADLAAFDFPDGHADAHRGRHQATRVALPRARCRETSIEFRRGGLEVFDATLAQFAERLRSENHTVKRSLTDPRLFSGIGNAYSDEILHRAKLSPVKLTSRLSDEEIETLFDATRAILTEWTERLRARSGRRISREGDGVPPGDGGARKVRPAVSRLRLARAAHSLR